LLAMFLSRLARPHAVTAVHRSWFHGTSQQLASLMVKVPNMGESITEGTVIEWVKREGDDVDIDDIVVVIETDKVSVDIRADEAGKILKLCAEEEATIEVGDDLFEIDLLGGSSESASTVSSDAEVATSSDVEVDNNDTVEPAAHRAPARTPLIKFLGKRALIAHEPVSIPEPQAAVSSVDVETPSTPGVRDFGDLPPMFKRIPFTDEEIELIELGGAQDEVKWTY